MSKTLEWAMGMQPELGRADQPNPHNQPEGRKDDSGKLLAGILYQDFPHALLAVAQVATFGARKYARSNWKLVPDAKLRYTDALHRHLLLGVLCENDGESGLMHAAHAAWNALAVLELELAANRKELEDAGK